VQSHLSLVNFPSIGVIEPIQADTITLDMDGRPRNIWQGKADEWAKIAESKELPSYERLIDLGERLAALPIAARRFADIVAVVGLETESWRWRSRCWIH
jgi:hypothetical protein